MDGATILGAVVAAVGLVTAAGDVLDAGKHPGADVSGEGVSVLAYPAMQGWDRG